MQNTTVDRFTAIADELAHEDEIQRAARKGYSKTDGLTSAQRERLRDSGLWLVTETGEGEWCLNHREFPVTFLAEKVDGAGKVAVTSNSGARYEVDFPAQACQCRDHVDRQRACKHIAAVNALAEHCREKRAARELELQELRFAAARARVAERCERALRRAKLAA